MKFNEEYIKNNILMPFLNDIGFNEYELEFETTFNIQLGRGVYNVKNDKVNEAGGRLDILCKIDGKNLFVIEMKAEEVEISDKDRRQALSYARLVEPMAAYSIVSNGKKTILYDTITGKEVERINNNVFSGDFVLELDEELSKLRFEALKSFIGYSYSNLLAFCKLNNEINLSKFCAKDSDEFSKKIEFKYIPELYVKRENIEEKFVEFIKQRNKKVFAVIGESGVGKTTILCYLSQKYIDEPFLFFSGSIMGKILLDEILNDFNTVFSSEESKISLLKKLSIIANIHKKEIIFIIDAIDEWEAEDKVSQLNQLVKNINYLNIKICISCKTLMWEEFKIKNGITTHVQDNIFFEEPILDGFSEKEFNEAIDKYCVFFQTSIIDKAILHNVQNPFNLRVACEVAKIDKQPLDDCIDSIETIRKYISRKLDKTNNKKLAKRYLRGISEYMLYNDAIVVSEESIRNYLKLGISDEIPEELFLFNFLYKYFDESGNMNIGFYFSGVRDYLISIEILCLNILNGINRREKIMSVISNYIGENALIYFVKTGNNKDKEDCLKTIIEYDKKYEKNTLVKFLSLKEIILYNDMNDILKKEILKSLKKTFIDSRDNMIISEKVINIMNKLTNIENDLIELFSILLKYPESTFVRTSHQIASLLQNYYSSDGTLKLVDMALRANDNGYVRRYIVESLSNRKIENKIKVFIKLITDNDPNVRAWVRGWYIELEDLRLRDMLLDMSDTMTNSRAIEDIFLVLGQSKIEDTGEKLYNKLLNKRYMKITTAWLCRSISDLKFTKAIPTFIRLFEENLDNDLAEHLAICFEELDVKESADVLFDKIKKDLDLNKHNIFIERAFAKVSSDEHTKLLMDYPIDKPNADKIWHKLIILSEILNRDYSDLIFNFIMDTNFEIDLRSSLLCNWGMNIIHKQGVFNNKVKILNHLYNLFNEKSEISVAAFNILISIEDDIEKFYKIFTDILPKFTYIIDFRISPLPNYNCVKKFSEYAIRWINRELMMNTKDNNKVYVTNLLKFCIFGGNENSKELIHSNRERFIRLTNEEYINSIEHCIADNRQYIRFI